MKRDIKIFPTADELAGSFAVWLIEFIQATIKRQSDATIALSGGNTPKLLFSKLAEKHLAISGWRNVQFFWVDERCVAPEDPESNFGDAYRLFFGKVNFPEAAIHRIKGEEDPSKEAVRYSEEIGKNTRLRNALPVFDLILLGLGNDGHTASIFPDKMELLTSEKICEVSVHPVTGQNRITLTGRVINNADNIVFLVTGESKAEVTEAILKPKKTAVHYPANYIIPVSGTLSWYLDREAARFIL